MQKFSKIVICVGALIMIILGMIVYDTWKDKIYFSLAVLFVTVLSLLWNIAAHNIVDKFRKMRINSYETFTDWNNSRVV
ncbi:hypothetical protein P9Y62_12680 [Bacillus thuringiensis]|nr:MULTISPECIES: hypothetical protein [Bacillus cereus group]AZV69352.1 hypothetical protein DT426_04270 [Bacillus cereus]MCU5457179.1 hypothetical protein [Bacillus cereus]MCU5622494.1 hypothetical protein [Bacillus cereus]MCU5677629.1 hypothetical protein [Bacillus cereus]MDA2098775.1 hypothetical protein [Bacillus cereus]